MYCLVFRNKFGHNNDISSSLFKLSPEANGDNHRDSQSNLMLRVKDLKYSTLDRMSPSNPVL